MVDPHDASLGQALEDVGYPASIVNLARAGHWSDFKTPLELPKMELVEMLRTDGHIKLAQQVMAGDFDG